MTKDEALKMAIEYIEKQEIKLSFDTLKAKADALNACYKALEQPAQEPVAWMHRHDGEIIEFNDFKSCEKCEPLYTNPHQWQGLTDDEINEIDKYTYGNIDFVRAIEQALKEKNG